MSSKFTGSGRDQIKKKKNCVNQILPKDIKVSILCAGQLIGQEDVILGRNYASTVKCISMRGSIYVIKAEEFLHRLSRDDLTWKIIKECSNIKENTIISSIMNNLTTTDEREKGYVKERKISQDTVEVLDKRYQSLCNIMSVDKSP